MNAADDGLPLTKIREVLEAYHRPLRTGIEEPVHRYVQLLAKWGEKMSLTAIKEPEEVIRTHFGESLFALSVAELAEGRLADVGTGAGFPGLALKLAIPELPVTLIEPNKRKCAFLHEVVRRLDLLDVLVIPAQFESSNIKENSLGTVTSRALSLEKLFFETCRTALSANGVVLLWLGAEDCRATQNAKNWVWQEPKLIPATRNRYILRGRPIRT